MKRCSSNDELNSLRNMWETATYQRGFEEVLALQVAQQDLAAQVAFLEELLYAPPSDEQVPGPSHQQEHI